jgi:hypothetical protein
MVLFPSHTSIVILELLALESTENTLYQRESGRDILGVQGKADQVINGSSAQAGPGLAHPPPPPPHHQLSHVIRLLVGAKISLEITALFIRGVVAPDSEISPSASKVHHSSI